MTKKELNRAMAYAKNQENREPVDFDDLAIFDGFGLVNFEKVYVTIRQLATLVIWQCFQFGGGIDNEALAEIATIGRTKFMVVD